MTDYLQPVGPWGRRLDLLACLATTFVGAAVTAFVSGTLIRERVVLHQGKPVWLGVGVVALLTAAAGWLSIRLWSGGRADGVTLMPTWFIEVFGALLLASAVGLLFTEQWRLVSLEGVGAALAMLLIRRQVRKQLHKRVNTTLEGERFQGEGSGG